jgi:hypothetical protein
MSRGYATTDTTEPNRAEATRVGRSVRQAPSTVGVTLHVSYEPRAATGTVHIAQGELLP